MNGDLFALEIQRARGRHAGIDQISHDFVLPVDGDDPAAGQTGEIDVVALSLKTEIQAVVTQPALLHSRTHAHRHEQIDRALFEDASAHPIDDVITAAVLDDDRIDAVAVQQLREHQPCRTCADDADLCSMTMCHV